MADLCRRVVFDVPDTDRLDSACLDRDCCLPAFHPSVAMQRVWLLKGVGR